MSNATETKEMPTIVEFPTPDQSELAPVFAHEAAPEPEPEPKPESEPEAATVLFEQPEASEPEPVTEAPDAPAVLGPAQEPSRRESQTLPTLVLVPEPVHGPEPEEPEALPQPEVTAVVPTLVPASPLVPTTVTIPSEPSVPQVAVETTTEDPKAAAVPALVLASSTAVISKEVPGPQEAAKTTTGELEAPSIIEPVPEQPIEDPTSPDQASQATQDIIEHVKDSAADKPNASVVAIPTPQPVVEDSEASLGPAPVPDSAPPKPETSLLPEAPVKQETSTKEAEDTLAPETPPSVVSTAKTNLSTSQRIRKRVANKIAVLRCPKEAIPIILYLSQRKKEGEDINPVVEAMMKTVGAQIP